MEERLPPLEVSVAGLSGAGKTSFLEHLVPALVRQGVTAGYLKANAHRIDLDAEGKDTQRLRRAGAAVTAIHGPGGGVHFLGPSVRDAGALLWNLRTLYAACDLLLCEGMKGSSLPKILINREDNPRGTLRAYDLTGVMLELRWSTLPVHWEEEIGSTMAVLRDLLDAPARIHAQGVLGAVLAAGASERMGRDKARLPLRGGAGTWLERAFLLLAARCPECWIVGRLSRAGGPDLPNLERPVSAHLDLRPEGGPLAGLETALRLARGNAILAIACDSPDLEPEVLDRLLEARDASADATVFRHPDGRIEPLPVLLEGSCLGRLRRALEGDERSIRRFLEGLSTRLVPVTPELGRLLKSRNTPEELRRYEQGLP